MADKSSRGGGEGDGSTKTRPIAVVTGGRDYELTPADVEWLLATIRERGLVGVIDGDANTWRKASPWGPRRRVGADRMAALACQKAGIPRKAYPYPGELGRRGGGPRTLRPPGPWGPVERLGALHLDSLAS